MRSIAGLCVVGVLMVGGLSCANVSGHVSANINGRDVLLVPEVNAGWVGWCMIWAGSTETGCPVVKSRPPVVAETWSRGGPPFETIGYAVTTSQVAFVTVDGQSRIQTYANRSLPAGLRAALVKIDEKPFLGARRPPYFTPLNSKGEAFPQQNAPSMQFRHPLGVEIPVQSLTNPAQP